MSRVFPARMAWSGRRHGRRLLAGLALVVAPLGAVSDQTPAPGLPAQGVARLSLTIEGAEARGELIARASTLIGFAQTPRTDEERQTLRLAKENLRAGEAMIRFDTRAACRLQDAKVEAVLPGAAPASGEEHARIQASYRYHCDQPKFLDSAALAFFTGFPALRRILVRYVTPDGQGGAELTRGHPWVNFVPF